MKNRIHNYPTSTSNAQNSEATCEEWRGAAQTRIVNRIRQAEKYIQMHPMASLGAVLGMGLFLGWVIKRK